MSVILNLESWNYFNSGDRQDLIKLSWLYWCLQGLEKTQAEPLGQKTILCPPRLLLSSELPQVSLFLHSPSPHHKEVVRLCYGLSGLIDYIYHSRSFQNAAFHPWQFAFLCSLFLQKKTYSFLTSEEGSVTLQSLEQLSFIHSANYQIIKSLWSDNTVLLVHSLYCITPTNIRLQYFLALKPLWLHVWYQNYCTMAFQLVMLSSLFSCPFCCSLPRACYCAKMFSKKSDQALFMDITKDQILG